MISSDERHWNDLYAERDDERLSWYQAWPVRSLEWVESCGLDPDAGIIDVGAGTSSLLASLWERGHWDLWWLDISPLARERAAQALGEAAEHLHWLVGDVTRIPLPRHRFAIWHDRAVFHFLTRGEERAAYVAQAREALSPGGHLMMATFAEDGPRQCSGLPTMRYDPESLMAEFGPDFELLRTSRERHLTPGGAVQWFRWFLLRQGA
ncbi:MAG: class I SAM-dependent methyltransferase [Gammaproteobacteria bacterium]|nr:MAG: class I SAM-dependent methyltransferase [Gammaproteobacteria bacterium]